MDESPLSQRNAAADLLGRGMHAVRESQDVGAELGLKSHPDVVVDDEMERASANTQDQAREFRRYLVLGSRRPAVILRPELGRVEGIILMIRAVKPVVDETIYSESAARTEITGGIPSRLTDVPFLRHHTQGFLEFIGLLAVALLHYIPN